MQQRKVGIVTGAAVGLGQQYARALAEKGYDLAICDLRGDVVGVAAHLAQTAEICAFGAVGDVADAAFVGRFVDQTIERYGRIDVLINNAATWRASQADDPLDKTLDDYKAVIGTNLRGTYVFGRAVIPQMVTQRSGNIINIATDHVHTHPGRPTSGGPAMDLYDVSKWGVLGLTVTWANGLWRHNIRVNSFSMGATDSHMLRGYFGHSPPSEILDIWMKPREVCDLAIQLIDEGPDGRTGENIGVWVGFEIELRPIPTAKPGPMPAWGG